MKSSRESLSGALGGICRCAGERARLGKQVRVAHQVRVSLTVWQWEQRLGVGTVGSLGMLQQAVRQRDLDAEEVQHLVLDRDVSQFEVVEASVEEGSAEVDGDCGVDAVHYVYAEGVVGLQRPEPEYVDEQRGAEPRCGGGRLDLQGVERFDGAAVTGRSRRRGEVAEQRDWLVEKLTLGCLNRGP